MGIWDGIDGPPDPLSTTLQMVAPSLQRRFRSGYAAICILRRLSGYECQRDSRGPPGQGGRKKCRPPRAFDPWTDDLSVRGHQSRSGPCRRCRVSRPPGREPRPPTPASPGDEILATLLWVFARGRCSWTDKCAG